MMTVLRSPRLSELRTDFPYTRSGFPKRTWAGKEFPGQNRPQGTAGHDHPCRARGLVIYNFSLLPCEAPYLRSASGPCGASDIGTGRFGACRLCRTEGFERKPAVITSKGFG